MTRAKSFAARVFGLRTRVGLRPTKRSSPSHARKKLLVSRVTFNIRDSTSDIPDLKRIRVRCTFPNEGAHRCNRHSQQCKMIKILKKTRIVRIVSFQTSLRRSLDPRHYTSRPSFQMLDACRISDVGRRMSDVGCRMSDVRCRMSDVRCRMSDVGCRISDVGCQMPDVESRMSDVGCRIWDIKCPMSDVGCQMSDVESRMSDFGYRISDVRCRMSNLGCRMSDVGSRMSKVGCRISDDFVRCRSSDVGWHL